MHLVSDHSATPCQVQGQHRARHCATRRCTSYRNPWASWSLSLGHTMWGIVYLSVACRCFGIVCSSQPPIGMTPTWDNQLQRKWLL